MKIFKLFLVFPALLILIHPLVSQQQRDQGISLRVFPEFIHFPSGDPDFEPVTPAEAPIIVEINVNQDQYWEMSILADGDLTSEHGGGIPIDRITWTASPTPPFVNGIMSKSRPQIMASGQGRSEIRGELMFQFRSSWSDGAGEYTQTFSITITAL